ncbi:MAG: hypothetical protein U9R24_02715 [Thermodesulfobacteriota bacterium]|nr:hypothetical protein [Thermodesulfobacteriota bacterium]
MRKLSSKGQRWLKCFHVFFVCCWVGAAVILTIMNFSMKASEGMQLYGIHVSMKFIDDFIIIPGAFGCLLTGLLYSVFTKWGWFKHRWVMVKWIINIFGIVFGTFWLGPWLNSLPPIAEAEGLNALSNPVYIHSRTMLYYWGTFQVATLIFAIFISTLKPWGKRKTKTNT